MGGHGGDEEEGGHEGHEGDEEEGSHEGHEGDEEEGSHESHEGDEEEGSHEGYEGDEEESSHEGHEGNEEEEREQDCSGPHGVCHGTPWKQGQDRWWLDCEGLDEEQERQDREQEGERTRQEAPMDAGCRQGAQGLEDHGILGDQEGHTLVCKGEGILQRLSATCGQGR